MAFYVKYTATAGMLIKTSLTYTENTFSEIYLQSVKYVSGPSSVRY